MVQWDISVLLHFFLPDLLRTPEAGIGNRPPLTSTKLSCTGRAIKSTKNLKVAAGPNDRKTRDKKGGDLFRMAENGKDVEVVSTARNHVTSAAIMSYILFTGQMYFR